MAITRADVEQRLIRRAGKKMAVAGLDGLTMDGTNADLNEALLTALDDMGLFHDPVNVTDSDLSAVENVSELLDRAELRIMENVSGNLDLVNVSIGPRSESLSQLSDQVEKVISRLEEKIAKMYGGGLGTLEGGTINLDFMEKYDGSGGA
jgi:hypothetical protein